MFDDRVFRVDHAILRARRVRLGAANTAAKVEIHGRAACEQEREHDEQADQHHGQQGNPCRGHR